MFGMLLCCTAVNCVCVRVCVCVYCSCSQLVFLSVHHHLRRLSFSFFLTLFLRGHSLKGSTKVGVPTSIANKLGLTLLAYGVIGIFDLF